MEREGRCSGHSKSRCLFVLTSNHLRHSQHQTDSQHTTAKDNAGYGRKRPPAARAQLDVAEGRENVGQGAGARRSDQLEHRTQIARDEADGHGAGDESAAEDQMPVGVVRLLRKPVVVHDLAADKDFKRHGGEHVETEAQTRNLHDGVALGREVVEDIAFGQGSEGQEARECHCQACNQRDESAVVGDLREAVYGWCSKRAIDQEGVVMAHECWREERRISSNTGGRVSKICSEIDCGKRTKRNDANRLKEAAVDPKLPF